MYKAIFQSLLNLRFSNEVQPNYVTNVGDGQLFGGLAVPEQQDGLISYFDSATDVSLPSPSSHKVNMLEQQILGDFDSIHAHMQDEDKRRVVVPFEMAGSHIEHSTFTVLENQLFPSPVPSEAINLSIFTIDVQLIGYLPQVLGLGGQHDNNTDNGYNPDGSAVEKPLEDFVVIQADKFAEDGHVRVKADRGTGDITVENIHD